MKLELKNTVNMDLFKYSELKSLASPDKNQRGEAYYKNKLSRRRKKEKARKRANKIRNIYYQ